MVNRITEVVSGELKINIRSMSLSPMRDGKIGGTINIEVPSTAVVDMVAANLMRIKGVEKLTASRNSDRPPKIPASSVCSIIYGRMLIFVCCTDSVRQKQIIENTATVRPLPGEA